MSEFENPSGSQEQFKSMLFTSINAHRKSSSMQMNHSVITKTKKCVVAMTFWSRNGPVTVQHHRNGFYIIRAFETWSGKPEQGTIKIVQIQEIGQQHPWGWCFHNKTVPLVSLLCAQGLCRSIANDLDCAMWSTYSTTHKPYKTILS